MTEPVPSSSPLTAHAVPVEAMNNLASRARPIGLSLMLLGADGKLLYHDSTAAPFFQRYVLPLTQRGAAEAPLAQCISQIAASSGVTVWTALPGVLLAAFPFVQRRQLSGILLLAAKSNDFQLAGDVSRRCDELGLKPQWLAEQAEPLPGRTEASLQRYARLILTMVRDQTRLSHLQSEVDGLSTQLANTYEELSLIYQISSGMRINRQAADFFKQTCLDVMTVLGVGGIGVALCGEHAARQGPTLYGELDLPAGSVERLADDLTPLLRTRAAPLLINDTSREIGLAWLAPRVKRLLAVPMQRQDQMLGFYIAVDKQDGEFDSQDSKLLSSIANESAIYLENAMLYDDARGLMMALLHSLTSALDAKDAYTHGHSERVAALARQLTLEAGLGEPLAERVYLTGLLHDVGKIGVPESVLHKTGRLTPEEFEHMKKHPQIGAKILADIKQIRDLIPGVLYHHERYDGNGYPHGLAGEKIPLMGRLICLADCFDAMTSNRTYRKALPLEVALTEIRRCSGTQFDPGLTEAFLRIGAEKLRELVLPPQKLAGAAGVGLLAAISAVPPQAA